MRCINADSEQKKTIRNGINCNRNYIATIWNIRPRSKQNFVCSRFSGSQMFAFLILRPCAQAHTNATLAVICFALNPLDNDKYYNKNETMTLNRMIIIITMITKTSTFEQRECGIRSIEKLFSSVQFFILQKSTFFGVLSSSGMCAMCIPFFLVQEGSTRKKDA